MKHLVKLALPISEKRFLEVFPDFFGLPMQPAPLAANDDKLKHTPCTSNGELRLVLILGARIDRRHSGTDRTVRSNADFPSSASGFSRRIQDLRQRPLCIV